MIYTYYFFVAFTEDPKSRRKELLGKQVWNAI